jgi:hypothetical protein
MPGDRPIIGDPVWYWDDLRHEWREGTVENVYDEGPRPPYFLIKGGGATLYSQRLVRPGNSPQPTEPPERA